MYKSISIYEELINKLDILKSDKDTILVYYDKKIKKEEFIDLIDKTSSFLLSLGLNTGDVLTFNLPNCVQAVSLLYAANKLGIIVNIVHPKVPITELLKKMNNCKSNILITYNGFIKSNACYNINILTCNISLYFSTFKKVLYNTFNYNKINKNRDYDYLLKKHKKKETISQFNHIAVYLHSSGTTGTEKCVIINNDAINNLSVVLQDYYEVNKDKDCMLTLIPLFHGFSLGSCIHASLTSGVKLVLQTKFNLKSFRKTFKKYKVTLFMGVPIIYEKLYSLPLHKFKDLKSLKRGYVGGDFCSNNLKLRFNQKLKEINSKGTLIEGYGLTETISVCAVGNCSTSEQSCVGYPLKNVDILIVDESHKLLPHDHIGEILISSNTLMDGYLNEENSFIILNNKNYLKTGDLGYITNEGLLYLIDRKKRIFKINGITIFPREIENKIKQLDYINDCISIQNDTNSYDLYVILNKHNKLHVKESIFKYFKENMISYASPNDIYFIKEFPFTNTNKVDISKFNKYLK